MNTFSTHDELLSASAAGSLSAPLRLLVNTYSAINHDAATRAHTAEAAAVALFEDWPGEALSEDAIDVALAAIDALEDGLGEAAMPHQVDRRDAALAADDGMAEIMALPEPLREHVLAAGAQWRFAAPGVRRIELMSEGKAKAELLRIEPGHGSPSHTHEGCEYTLVLEGAFADGLSRYGKGDLCIADEGMTHRPIAEPGEVCFALAVTDGSLRFTGALGTVQRLLGG